MKWYMKDIKTELNNILSLMDEEKYEKVKEIIQVDLLGRANLEQITVSSAALNQIQPTNLGANS